MQDENIENIPTDGVNGPINPETVEEDTSIEPEVVDQVSEPEETIEEEVKETTDVPVVEQEETKVEEPEAVAPTIVEPEVKQSEQRYGLNTPPGIATLESRNPDGTDKI